MDQTQLWQAQQMAAQQQAMFAQQVRSYCIR
jgi:hypothetical protein